MLSEEESNSELKVQEEASELGHIMQSGDISSINLVSSSEIIDFGNVDGECAEWGTSLKLKFDLSTFRNNVMEEEEMEEEKEELLVDGEEQTDAEGEGEFMLDEDITSKIYLQKGETSTENREIENKGREEEDNEIEDEPPSGVSEWERSKSISTKILNNVQRGKWIPVNYSLFNRTECKLAIRDLSNHNIIFVDELLYSNKLNLPNYYEVIWKRSKEREHRTGRMTYRKKQEKMGLSVLDCGEIQNLSVDIVDYLQTRGNIEDVSQGFINKGLTDHHRTDIVFTLLNFSAFNFISQETYFRAIAILDHYIFRTKKTIQEGSIFLIGVTCLFIAMKYSEMHPLPVEILANKFNNGLIHYKQILSMELDIFSTLSFYVSFPTSYEILSFYLASLTKSLLPDMTASQLKLLASGCELAYHYNRLLSIPGGNLEFKPQTRAVGSIRWGFHKINEDTKGRHSHIINTWLQVLTGGHQKLLLLMDTCAGYIGDLEAAASLHSLTNLNSLIGSWRGNKGGLSEMVAHLTSSTIEVYRSRIES